MTGKEVYERACAYLFEKPGVDTAFYNASLHLINNLIAEAIPYQNNRNRAEGKEEVKSIRIKELNDDIALDAPIVEIALPFGLASYFFQDEHDTERSNEYRSRFVVALQEASVCETMDITDEYATESEE